MWTRRLKRLARFAAERDGATLPRSKEREVVRCQCRVQDRAERLLAAAKIPARYEHCDLSKFHYDPDNPDEHDRARSCAGRFVEDYPVEKTGLLLVGQWASVRRTWPSA